MVNNIFMNIKTVDKFEIFHLLRLNIARFSKVFRAWREEVVSGSCAGCGPWPKADSEHVLYPGLGGGCPLRMRAMPLASVLTPSPDRLSASIKSMT